MILIVKLQSKVHTSVLGLGVDFVSTLSQEEPPPKYTKKKRVELASQLKMLVLKIFGKKKCSPKTFWSINIALNGLKILLEEAEMGGTIHTYFNIHAFFL